MRSLIIASMLFKLELKECFRLFDKDNSGTISVAELKKVVESMGIKASGDEVKALMKLMDKDG